MNVKDLLGKVEKLYQEALETEKEAQDILAAARQRMLDIDAREAAVSDIESAASALSAANKLTGALEAKQVEIDNARADFDNYKRVELKKIADATAKLSSLQEQEAALYKERETYRADLAALEKEKAEYRERIKKELVAHFKNTQG